MVHGSLAVAQQLITDRTRRLREEIAALPRESNEPFVSLLRAILDRVEQDQFALRRTYQPSSDELPLLLEDLDRLAIDLNTVHLVLATYQHDLDARLPVGLTHLVYATVAEIVDKPLKIETNLLIHLDANNNYSVQDLLNDLKPLLVSVYECDIEEGEDEDRTVDNVTDNGQNDDSRPLILNLPALDPANAFLAPILAHEVAHIACNRRLLEEVWIGRDEELINRLYAEHATDLQSYNREALEARLRCWLEEELCDAVACAVTGPAFLFAQAAFLPAGKPGIYSDHPFPADRIRWALLFLANMGWTEWLENQTPNCLDYLRSVADPSHDPHEGEAFLRAYVEENLTLLHNVATKNITALTPASFEETDRAHELCEAISRSFMPPRLQGGQAPGLWHLLLAGWISWIGDHEDDPSALTRAIADAQVNRFLIKALELSGIAELWEAG